MTQFREYENKERDYLVRRALVIEGLANVFVLVIKLAVGLWTGSLAILADAVHSVTDVSNNVLAWFVTRASAAPPDSEHPYGHRKFESLAVFFLATLLAVMAIELLLHMIRREPSDVDTHPLAIAGMVAVLVINIGITVWQRRQAKRLDSDILYADASHTLSDVLITLVVIAGWQLSALGHVWVDQLCAAGVAVVVLYLAIGLYRRVIPALTDERSVDAESVSQCVAAIEGVHSVRRVRSRWKGSVRAVDIVVTVDSALSTIDGHHIADEIELLLHEKYSVQDVTVHLEPSEMHGQP